SSHLFKPIVWIDCEMTGLDIQVDHIIEICCLITDENLNIIDLNGYENVINFPLDTLIKMNDWCKEHHTKSGLVKKILNSNKNTTQVQSELLSYIQKFVLKKNKALLAGNSVHMDRLFMLKEFDNVIDYLHYRIIDVSSIMEVGKRHNPMLLKLEPRKNKQHTAKADILESIQQLKWYTQFYFKS
ncbi:Rex2p, partial [Ascoidea rubescens DSM 1968]